jgi:hypothetical protein
MRSVRVARCVLVVLLSVVLGIATPALARFGKASSGHVSIGGGGAAARYGSGGGYSGTSTPYYYGNRPYARNIGWGGYGWGYRPTAAVGTSDDEPATRVVVNAEGYIVKDGGAVGVDAIVEGQRFGVHAVYTGLFLRPDDGSDGLDAIHLIDFHASYAVLTGERGRLRLELGGNLAAAPDIVMVGPSAGVSGML